MPAGQFFQSYSVAGSAPERIAYRIATSQEQRAGAFRLLHDAYVRAGLMLPNAQQMRVTPHHLLPTTTVFVAEHDAEVIATISLIGDGRLGLPMESICSDEVNLLRSPSRWLGEVSALACRERQHFSRLDVLVNLMRLMAQFARQHGIEHLLAAVHPRHVRFYQNCLGFSRIGPLRAYPAVRNRPAVALMLDLAAMEEAPHPNYEIFFGTPMSDERLRYSPISARERAFFATVAQSCEAGLVPAAPAEDAALACAS